MHGRGRCPLSPWLRGTGNRWLRCSMNPGERARSLQDWCRCSSCSLVVRAASCPRNTATCLCRERTASLPGSSRRRSEAPFSALLSLPRRTRRRQGRYSAQSVVDCRSISPTGNGAPMSRRKMAKSAWFSSDRITRTSRPAALSRPRGLSPRADSSSSTVAREAVPIHSRNFWASKATLRHPPWVRQGSPS